MGKIVVPSRDSCFMTMVYLISAMSKDKRTHIGAVVVGPDKEIRSMGYNSFPRGLDDNRPERQKKPEKYYWFEHAERNAMDNATLIGVSLKGCKMYTNGVPCMDCARGIVQSGIEEVIVDKNGYDADNKRFEEINRAKRMFRETGVKFRYWEGEYVTLVKVIHAKVTPLGKT